MSIKILIADDHQLTIHQWRAAFAPLRRVGAVFGDDVMLPKRFACCAVETSQVSERPERIHLAFVDRGRRSRADAGQDFGKSDRDAMRPK